jgi:hypothetical protein
MGPRQYRRNEKEFNMSIVTLTMQLPEGYQRQETGRTEVIVRNAAGEQISSGAGQGSNMAPNEPAAQEPWQYRFQVDPKTTLVGEKLSVTAKIHFGATAFFLGIEQVFAWDGSDQHVDIPLNLAPASLAETVQAPAFGS